LFNSLKVGGTLLLESGGRDLDDKNIAHIEFFGTKRGGSNWFVPSRKAIEFMLEDVGFKVVSITKMNPNKNNDRIYAYAIKKDNIGMRKAGLSIKDI